MCHIVLYCKGVCVTLYCHCNTIERLLTIMDHEEGSFQDYPTGHNDTVHGVQFGGINGDILFALCDNIIYVWTVVI